PVSKVGVTADTATDLVEFSGPVTLSCSVFAGSSLSYVWMNGSSEINGSSVGVQIGEGGKTLTILNVTRYDSGSYRCRAFNPVSDETSAEFTLLPSLPGQNTISKTII
ncbi:hypothetical protein CRUP_037823, partial [Coryphaenoides rupestris]